MNLFTSHDSALRGREGRVSSDVEGCIPPSGRTGPAPSLIRACVRVRQRARGKEAEVSLLSCLLRPPPSLDHSFICFPFSCCPSPILRLNPSPDPHPLYFILFILLLCTPALILVALSNPHPSRTSVTLSITETMSVVRTFQNSSSPPS